MIKTIHQGKIRSRIKDDTDWSALNKAIFSMDNIASNLRITELMYHPVDPNDEFIEGKGNEEANCSSNIDSRSF